jgi:hypothetical protein
VTVVVSDEVGSGRDRCSSNSQSGQARSSEGLCVAQSLTGPREDKRDVPMISIVLIVQKVVGEEVSYPTPSIILKSAEIS